MDGFLVVYKPTGITSHDVVYRLRKATGIRRIGHAGTLDPMAEGLLYIAIGRATRLLQYIDLEPKIYLATCRFGQSTNTQDADGNIVADIPAEHITETDVLKAIQPFIGSIQQIPPMYSAVHHKGQRLYEIARRGIELERPSREALIHYIKITKFTPGLYPTAELEVSCGAGTYVRTLCHDIGEKLRVGAHLTALTRIRLGKYSLEHSTPLEGLTDASVIKKSMIDVIKAIYEDEPVIVFLHGDELESVKHGNSIPAIFPLTERRPIPLTDTDHRIWSFAALFADMLQPLMVFDPPIEPLK